MWPFKKKALQQGIIAKSFKTVICIPGNWNSWSEFILEVVSTTDGAYLAAGNTLMDAKNQRYFPIEFCERDEKLKRVVQICWHSYGSD